MISPELLCWYPFFSGLRDGQRKAIANAAEEISCKSGTILFNEGESVEALYFLLQGCVDLYYTGSGNAGDQSLICEISPGEPFGISALIEPYTFTATARVAGPSRILKIDAARLRRLCELDDQLGYALMQQVAKTLMERLHYTRVQLAVATA